MRAYDTKSTMLYALGVAIQQEDEESVKRDLEDLEEEYQQCCEELHAWQTKWFPLFKKQGVGYAMVRAGVTTYLQSFDNTTQAVNSLKIVISKGIEDFNELHKENL